MKRHKHFEVQVDFHFLRAIQYDKLNCFDLRSDIENNNLVGVTLVAGGYCGNRPTNWPVDKEHEDDTWAIDVADGQDGDSYLYTSELEYFEDLELLGATTPESKSFRVFASATTRCYLDVVAGSEAEAMQIGKDTDGGDFTTDDEWAGSWDVYQAFPIITIKED